MADSVRNEVLALSRSRTASKDGSPNDSASVSRRFNEVKAAFNSASDQPASPERPAYGGRYGATAGSNSPTR